MDKAASSTQSSLHISEDVVVTIVSETLRELGGIHSLQNLPGRMKLIGAPEMAKPVRLSIEGDVARVDVGIVVNMSCRLKEVCEQAQTAVKDAVQNMTGIAVSKVNVHVLGVYAPEKAAGQGEGPAV